MLLSTSTCLGSRARGDLWNRHTGHSERRGHKTSHHRSTVFCSITVGKDGGRTERWWDGATIPGLIIQNIMPGRQLRLLYFIGKLHRRTLILLFPLFLFLRTPNFLASRCYLNGYECPNTSSSSFISGHVPSLADLFMSCI